MATPLLDEPFILSLAGCAQQIGQFFARSGVACEPAYQVRDVPTILAMVPEGLG